MKVDIEVVGERCRRKDECRLTRAQDVTSSPCPSSGDWSPGQPPGTPEEGGKPCNGHVPGSGRKGQVGRSFSAVYRRSPCQGPQGVARGEMGVKVRICYVDPQGRVSHSPRSMLKGTTSHRTTEHRKLEDQGPATDGHHGLSGWGSTVSITSLVERLHRPKTVSSARDRVFQSLTEDSFQPRHAGQKMATATRSSSRALGMPAINTHRTQLAASSSGSLTSPVSGWPKLGGVDDTASTKISDDNNTTTTTTTTTTTNNNNNVINTTMMSNSSFTTNTTTSNANNNNSANSDNGMNGNIINKNTDNTTNSTRDSYNDINGTKDDVFGKPPAAVCPLRHWTGHWVTGAHYSRSGSRLWLDGRVGGSLSVRSLSHAAGSWPRTNSRMSPDRCYPLGLSDTVKLSLRNMFIERRTQSVITGRWRWPRGHASRAKAKRKTGVNAWQGVGRDPNSDPPVSRMFRKFRMVGFITITLIRLKAAIVVNSLDRTERSAAEIQWRTLYGQQEVDKLAFNKAHFSRERISTKMPNWAVRVFEVPPEKRTEQDCRRLHALFRSMRSFNKFTEKIQMNLCRAVSYTCVEESRIVLRRGHVGHNFYFVYSGSVFVNVQDIDSDGEPFIKTEAILGRGDSFGELALLKDIRRTATVSVRETCELLVVDKDVFCQVCPAIFEKELLEKQKFLRRLSLFSSKWWSQDALSALCLEAQIQEFKINKIVVENNTTEEWLYICMEGKCQVIRCLSEGGWEDKEEEDKSREQSVVLAEEIIELLAASSPCKMREEDKVAESSKEKLLSSLGLEYVATGKRDGAFLEEVEAEERRKALLASTAPMTLTSLMAQKQKEGRSGLVYLNVGTLESPHAFDMCSLIKAPVQRTHGALLLVSSGARMLRLKKSAFLKLASPQAMEHTRTLVSKHPFPTEEAIMESYKRKVIWNSYKAKVVQDVVRSKTLYGAFSTHERQKSATCDSKSARSRSQRLDHRPETSNSMSAEGSETGHDGDKVSGAGRGPDFEATEEHPQSAVVTAREVEMDSHTEPHSVDLQRVQSLEQQVGSIEARFGVGPGPEAVVVRRKSLTPCTCRPAISADTTFITRKHRPPEDTSSIHIIRFN